MEGAQHNNSRRVASLSALACAALLAVMFALGWLAIQTKSPTMDEPLHALGGFLHVHYRDWRINPEDPPLWNYWFTLPHARDALRLDFNDPDWPESLANTDYQFRFVVRSLFQTPGNDGVTFIQRSRLMMLLGAVLMLGPLVAWWGWKLGGATVAVGATLMLALDPNFLAHAPLVKNDVGMTLVTLALAAATWAVGRKLTWWNALLPGAVCGIGLGVKFSAVLLGPILLCMLAARALLGAPWTCFGRSVATRRSKLLVAFAVCAVAFVLSWSIVWSLYGFRFDATPETGSRLPTHIEVKSAARWHFYLAHAGRFPTEEELARTSPSPAVRAVLFAERHRLLPQPWLYGFLYTYRSTLARDAFLMGRHSVTGWWYYFPLAMLFKTPLATLATFALALFALLIVLRARGRNGQGSAMGFHTCAWRALCLTIPLVIYGASAITSNLNLGLRHVLPVYPFLYLLSALVLAQIARNWRTIFRPIALVLAMGLAVETFANFPDYIPFFNAAFRPHRLVLLSDSNLDWGQDLPAAALWQQRHPASAPLYFCFFGTTDPNVYGIDYLRLPGGFWMGPPIQWTDGQDASGALAISATLLQGVHVPPSMRFYYAPLRELAPHAVLGGSIYVYPLPLPGGTRLALPTREQIERASQRE
jgi:hypothetical protein